MHHRVLGRVVHGQPIAFPAGDRGEEPHRIVGHRRRGEGLVVDHLGGGQRGGDITAIDVLPPRDRAAPGRGDRRYSVPEQPLRSRSRPVAPRPPPVRASAPPRRPRAGPGAGSGCPSSGNGGDGPSRAIGASTRAGAFSCVITARTPGAASAFAASMPLMVPAAIVDCTSTAWARSGKVKSDG